MDLTKLPAFAPEIEVSIPKGLPVGKNDNNMSGSVP
jgi:hypothetical protein